MLKSKMSLQENLTNSWQSSDKMPLKVPADYPPYIPFPILALNQINSGYMVVYTFRRHHSLTL